MIGVAETTAIGRVHPAQVHRGGVRVAVALTVVAVIMVLLVSNMVLIAAGIPYGSPGGSLVLKIHPVTYLSAVAVLVWAWASGGFGRFVARLAVERPGIIALTAGIVLLLFHAAAVVKLSLSPIIDTFILPVLLYAALVQIDERTRARLEILVHVVLVANAALGVVEYVSGWRLTPMYDIDGTVIGFDWRSTALFGHPLANAFMNGNYFVALACGATPRLPRMLRYGFMGLTVLAMIAFGGRTAMVVGLAFGGVFAAIGAAKTLAGNRFSMNQAILGVAVAALGAIAVVMFLDSGGADRFFDRFTNDHGSAKTRVSMLKIFGDLTWEQFLLWPDAELIVQAQREFSLRIGVESSEVAFVANYGLIPTLVFFAALAAFLRELVRGTSPVAWWSVTYFVVIMSASIGIAAKTTALALFVVVTHLIMPRPETIGEGAAPETSATNHG